MQSFFGICVIKRAETGFLRALLELFHHPEGFVAEGDFNLLSDGEVQIPEGIIGDGDFEEDPCLDLFKEDAMMPSSIGNIRDISDEDIPL